MRRHTDRVKSEKVVVLGISEKADCTGVPKQRRVVSEHVVQDKVIAGLVLAQVLSSTASAFEHHLSVDASPLLLNDPKQG